MNAYETLAREADKIIDPVLASQIESLPDEPMPEHLHGKIMKRVFIAGYGRYFVFLAGILTLNLSVLSMNLYRAFTSADFETAIHKLGASFQISPAYATSALETLYRILPLESLVAASLTLALSVYIAALYVRVIRNPYNAKFLNF